MRVVWYSHSLQDSTETTFASVVGEETRKLSRDLLIGIKQQRFADNKRNHDAELTNKYYETVKPKSLRKKSPSRRQNSMVMLSCLPVSAEATPGSAVASISTVAAPASVAAPAAVSTPAATTAPPSVHALVDRKDRQQHQQQGKLQIPNNKKKVRSI